jgi:hypothetical protein
VLRWIDFNSESGPERRKRLIGELSRITKEITAIEDGNPADPFRWMRDCRDIAAAAVANEILEVVDYVDGLICFINSMEDEWLGPLSPAEWQKRLNMGESTFARRRKSMRVDEITTKSIRIHRDDVARYENK